MRSVRLFVAGLFAMLIGSTAWAAACAGFSDVDSSSGFCQNVQWLKDRQITLGCTASTYCPNDAVNRLAMAAFLNRLGVALQPAFITTQNVVLPVLTDGTVICTTQPFTATGFARVATGHPMFTFKASSSVDAGAELVSSVDGGTNWNSMSPLVATGANVAAHFVTLSPISTPTVVPAGNTAIFGIRVTGAISISAGVCALSVRLDASNE